MNSGLLWGAAGFLIFSGSPALGLPPELPGMTAAALDARQTWWIGTVIATAIGIGLFSETKPDEIIQGLEKDDSFTFDVNGTKISLDANDFIIEFDVQEGFTFSRRNNLIVIISTERNEELMAKGLIKDLARRLQALRKERGYNPTDVLNTASVLDLDEESLSMIKNKTEELSFLVRVKQVNFTQTCKKYKDDDIDGQKIRISVE